MKFGPLPLTRALGAVLAHSLPLAGGRLVKGLVLGPAELARLRDAGLTEVTVARADPGDIAEDQAAQAIAGHAAGPGIALATPLHGRVNLTATAPGVLRVNGLGVAALNRVDEAITLATLPDYAKVGAGTLVATAKMIPYFVDGRRLASACAEVSEIHVLLLAAGASARMRGADKLLRDIHGEPLLRRSAHAACNSGAARVHVTLPEGHSARRAALKDLDLVIVPVANSKAGMAASLRAGIAALPASAGAVIIALADMPDLTPAHYDALITAAKTSDPDEILRARTAAGTPGHPVLFGRGYFEELAGLQGDQGARALLQRANTRVRLIPTPGAAAACDLDTPEDFDAWEQRAQQPPGP